MRDLYGSPHDSVDVTVTPLALLLLLGLRF